MMQKVRWQSSIKFMGLPLYHIALGPDLAAGQMRGHARGIVAIGDIATGVLAIGGLAGGVVAIGGCAMGLIAVGGAVGYYACGGGAFGAHVLSGMRQDPEMVELVKRLLPWFPMPMR